MAVDPNIDELLSRLANVKRLPAPEQPFRTQQAATGAQLRDAAGRAFASTPRLADAIQGIQQGGSAQTGATGRLASVLGSPVGKVVLGGLNVIDAPRRAVITGLKEANDYLDLDPNTTASFKDLKTQFNDPTFGFGRVAPMKGWKGRIVGFIGDVALDPLTYATLGGTVAATSVAKGAGAAGLRATAKVGAQDVALRAALGTKNVTGREGRFALANLVRQYGGNADEVAAVASRGKSAVPDDIAKVIGLQRNGLYMFGSRVRLPGSGPIASAIETGLVKARLGITNTNIGKKLQYLYTPRGASGTFGDLSTTRADIASGRLPKDKVDLVMAGLTGAENGRRRGASYGQQYLRDAKEVADRPDVVEFDDQIHRFIETADIDTLSPSQRAAMSGVQDHWERVRILLETEGQKIDPSFRLNIGAVDPVTGRPRYIPHVQTQEAYRWRLKNSTSPWAKLLDEQTSVDVLDMNNNLAARYFKPKTKFLGTEDVIQTGSIDELNALWRKHTGLDFDLFETSTRKILAGYEQTVRGAIEAFSLLDELKNSDLVRLLRTQGEIDPAYLRSLERMVKDKTDEVARLSGVARSNAEELVRIIKQDFDTNYRRSAASAVQREIVDVRGEVRAGERAVGAAQAAADRASVLQQKLNAVIQKQQNEAVALAAMFDEKNLVMQYMDDALRRSIDEGFELGRQAEVMRQSIANNIVSAEQAEQLLEALEQKAKDAVAAFKRAEETVEYYRLYGDELGPALQNIYERIRLADSDMDTYRVLEEHLQEGLFSGTEKVNEILNILMRPFSNTGYENSADLGQKWLSDSLNDIGDVGKLLNSIPDLFEGGRATRAAMARAGKSKRRLSTERVNEIIGRASTIGDNHAEMADAFFFLTARELRAVYDANGGGVGGLAAQAQLAKELSEGVTERAKLWKSAKDAVDYVAKQRKIIDEIGSRRVQTGGRYVADTETIKRIAEIDEEIAKLSLAGIGGETAIYATYSGVKNAVETFVSGDSQTSARLFQEMQRLLDEIGLRKPELRAFSEYAEFEAVVAKSLQNVADGELPAKYGIDNLWTQMDEFIRREFTDERQLRELTQTKRRLEQNAQDALKRDKRATDASGELLESSRDAGVKLANYHILHATRLAMDAIGNLTPNNSAPSEALFAFARSGAARQQLKHVTDYQRTIAVAEQVMERVRSTVFGERSVADRATVLLKAIQDLPDNEREAVYAVIGDLSYIEKQLSVGTKIEVARRTTQEYVNVRDRVWALVYGDVDWRSQFEIEQMDRYVRVPSRVKRYGGDATGAPAMYDDEGKRIGAASQAQQAEINARAREARNRILRMESATPDTLKRQIGFLVKGGDITPEEAIELRAAVDSAERAAKQTQIAARERAKATGVGERAAKRRARGVLRSADETFGMSRAFWFATQTREDGSTLSNQRILDFFTMVFGDGEVRVANSGGFKRPVSVREIDEGGTLSINPAAFGPSKPEDIFNVGVIGEDSYKQITTAIINRAKADKREAVEQLSARGIKGEARAQALRDIELNYWRTLGNEENALVDFNRVAKMLDDIEREKVNVKMLKADLADKTARGAYTEQTAASLRAAEGRIKNLRKSLDAMEREATQLVTRGTASPEQTFKYISISDSVLGKTRIRTALRAEALRTLARDPGAASAFGIETGLNRNEVLSGTFGYVEYLRGRLAEQTAAVEAVERARASLGKVEGKVARASQARRSAIETAERIASNPKLARIVDAAIDIVSDDEVVRDSATRRLVQPKKAKFLGAKRLGADDGPIPAEVAKIVNDQRRTKQTLLEIEKTAEYTAAVERQFRHKVLLTLAGLNLTDEALEFPQATFNEEVLGSLRRFAQTGSGVRDNIDPNSVFVFDMEEASLDNIVDAVLNAKADKYVFSIDGVQIPQNFVRDAIIKRNNGNFRYMTEVKDVQGTKMIHYVDKTTGTTMMFDEVAPEGFVPSEVVVPEPIYTYKRAGAANTISIGDADTGAEMTQKYNDVLNGRLTVFRKRGRISVGKEGDSFFDPSTAYAVYGSPQGNRLYRMDTIVGVKAPRGSNPLDPQNLFDERQGRGIIDGFGSLFEKPSTPFSEQGRKLRAQLAKKREQYDELAASHAKRMDEMRSASSDKVRRSKQAAAASLSERMEELAAEMDDLGRRISNSSPVTQMVTVENVVRVIDYLKSNPELLRRLGVDVEVPPVTVDALGRTVRAAGPTKPPTDDDVLDGLRTYVEVLEYGSMNPRKGQPKKNVLPTEEVKRRRRVLNEIFRDSPEGELLARHRNATNRLAANQRELISIKAGGKEVELYDALLATREEVARAERALGLTEKNLGKALRKQKPAEGETVAAAAERIALEEEARLSAQPLKAFEGSVSDEAKSDALRAVRQTEDVSEWYSARTGVVGENLKALRATIAADTAGVKKLQEQQQTILERIATINKVLAGEGTTRQESALLGEEMRLLRMQLNGVGKEKGLKVRINEALRDIAALEKQRKTIEAQLVQERSAVDVGFYMDLNLNDARKRLDLLNASLEDMRSLRARAKVGKGKNDGWLVEFDEFTAEVSDLMNRLNSMPDGPDTRRLANVLTGYLEGKANLLRATGELGDVRAMEVMSRSGQMFAAGDHVIFSQVLDDGWQKLTGSGALKSFEGLQMKPEVAEILTNMGRLRDPVFVKQMRIWFGPYTRFFKAWALSTPGYHVRNSLTNAFMLVAAGGRPQFLADGMREYNQLYKALKSGTSIDDYLGNLPANRRSTVSQAYEAMLGSGVGQSEEIAFDTAGVLTNNPITRANRRAGAWVEQHSRFMLAYDGIRQGLDINGATARTRKFLFDYEDISTLDAYARSIIPFWMWTSRNLPLTIQNIYMNPRPYQWYQSVRRNLEDEEQTQGMPLYLREAGGFALPGGNLAATPDLGFNRLQADVRMLTEPTRFAANINPALRIPAELVANKSFFRNREFAQTPVNVEGPVGNLASLLGAPIGMGGSSQGQPYVDERLLYALTNAVPLLNQAERFIPSQQYYQQRGSTNPLLGFLGAPVREVTPQMRTSEQKRLLAELQKLVASQPKPAEE